MGTIFLARGGDKINGGMDLRQERWCGMDGRWSRWCGIVCISARDSCSRIGGVRVRWVCAGGLRVSVQGGSVNIVGTIGTVNIVGSVNIVARQFP